MLLSWLIRSETMPLCRWGRHCLRLAGTGLLHIHAHDCIATYSYRSVKAMKGKQAWSSWRSFTEPFLNCAGAADS